MLCPTLCPPYGLDWLLDLPLLTVEGCGTLRAPQDSHHVGRESPIEDTDRLAPGERPHTVWHYGTENNRPVGAPQVETSGDGKALVAWASPPDDGGRVDLDSVVVRRDGPSSSLHRLASDVDPGGRALRFGVRVNDSGDGGVVLRHTAPCSSDPGTVCHTVSAALGSRIGRLHDPVVLFASPTTPYETVSMALSNSGVALVLAVERGATVIEARSNP